MCRLIAAGCGPVHVVPTLEGGALITKVLDEIAEFCVGKVHRVHVGGRGGGGVEGIRCQVRS